MPRFKSSYPEHQTYEDRVTLLEEQTLVTVGNGTGTVEAEIPCDSHAIVAILSGYSACNNADKLDVWVQTQLYAGDDVNGNPIYTWCDIVHFVQVNGDDGAQTIVDKIMANWDEDDFLNVERGLAAGTKRHLFGRKYRVVWTITDGGGAHSFQYGCSLQPM